MELPVFGVGTTEYTVVSDPGLATDVLRDAERFEQYSDIGEAMAFENPFSSPADDDIAWAAKRAAYDAAFSGDSYREAITAAETRISEEVSQLRTGTWYDTTTLMRRLTMRMAATILLGQTPPADVEGHLEAAANHALHVTNLDRTSFAPVWTPRPSLFNVWRQRDPIMSWVDDAIASAPDHTLISTIADALDVELADDRLRGIALFPLVAGFVSPEVMLSTCIDRLGQAPECKSRLEEAATDLPATPTNRDLIACRETIRWPLFEALRLFPPTFFLTRRATQDTTLGGHTVAAGEYLWVDQWSTGRHPAYWDEPERFRPERWAEHSPRRDAFIPFGAGDRDCPGVDLAFLQGELILANLFGEFDVEIRSRDLGPADVVGGMSLEFPPPEIRLQD